MKRGDTVEVEAVKSASEERGVLTVSVLMKFFLDTANLNDIREAAAFGFA